MNSDSKINRLNPELKRSGAGRFFADLLIDVFAIGGMGAIIYGVRLWSVPAAWILGGIFALALAALWQLQVNRDKST